MDFVVLKVNGRDVSTASHEDTIAAFTSAKEPIIVEVRKRPRREDPAPLESVSLLCDTSTQTELSLNDWNPACFPLPQFSLMPPPNDLMSDLDKNHYSSIAAADMEADEDEACQVEYEEVVLLRSPQDAKLGLTLCYRAPEDPDTDIYISEVEADSIAARDGRIQEGDQLLQINGVEVKSRDQAVRLFSERRTDFTLLLARPQILEHEEEEEEDDGTTDTNALHEKDSGVGRTDESTKNDESSEHDAADTNSIPGDFSPYPAHFLFNMHNPFMKTLMKCSEELTVKQQDFPIQTPNSGVTLAPLCRFQSDASLDREMALLNKEMENIQMECETLVHRHLESQQKDNTVTDASKCHLEHVYVNLSDLNIGRNVNGSHFSMNKKQTVEKWVNSMYFPRKCSTVMQDRDSSSAYNTAESSGSGRLTLELTPMCGRYEDVYGSVMSLISPKMEDKGTQLRDSDVASMFSCDSCRRCCKALVGQEGISAVLAQNNPNFAHNNNNTSVVPNNRVTQNKSYPYVAEPDSSLEHQNENYVSFFPASNTMYTNEANLQHTMWLQQQMLRQAVTQQNISKSTSSDFSSRINLSNHALTMNSKCVISTVNKTQSISDSYVQNSHPITSSSSKSGTLSTVREDDELKMEWKVKRRADGTRYITRRPVRNRLLKARAMKILEERTGITTDDDAVSELKTGRYWSKEERKRHLEKARDRKRKEIAFRTKMSSVKEQNEECDEAKKEPNILELSHKKMMKRRGKVVFDDFTTIQEVLAHGTKVSNAGAKPLGLLTVTTV